MWAEEKVERGKEESMKERGRGGTGKEVKCGDETRKGRALHHLPFPPTPWPMGHAPMA